jgi:PAS domain S-box-containing protein
MLSMHKRFGVIVGFFALLILLVINTVVVRHQLAVQVGNQEWFSHSRRVVQELRITESLVKDAEAGQRGFLYTGKQNYLLPYNRAIGQMDAHLKNLVNSIGDNPKEQSEAANLRVLIHKKLDELAETISLFRSGDAPAAKALVMSDQGFNLMEGIHALVEQMEQDENSVGNARREAYQKSIRITAACIYLASAVAALGLSLLAFSVFRDMRRRERDAAALRQSEEWFRVTLSSIAEGVIATDHQGMISFLNPVAERLTGSTLEEARGKKIYDIFPIFNEATNSPVENPVEKVLTLGAVVGLANHTVLRHREGHLIPIEDSAAPITDDSGHLIGVVLVFRDASHERSLQEVLRRTEKLAAAARLAATVAHEINNPLEAVGNLIFLARTNSDANEAVEQHLKMAEQELARVSHITRQTLGFYRESTLPSRVDIPTVVEQTLTVYATKLQQKQIRLHLSLQQCPPINGFAGEIQQLVSNIISNAIDALPFNGTLKIDSSTIKLVSNEAIKLQIEDDGPGISPENMRRIFDPFFTTKKDVGTGLGLWVCKEIAERHGGTVEAKSNNQNDSTGAVFTIVLPYRDTSTDLPL